MILMTWYHIHRCFRAHLWWSIIAAEYLHKSLVDLWFSPIFHLVEHLLYVLKSYNIGVRIVDDSFIQFLICKAYHLINKKVSGFFCNISILVVCENHCVVRLIETVWSCEVDNSAQHFL